MSRSPLAFAILAAATLAVPSAAPAQRPGEITLFSQTNYRGRTFVVSGQRQVLALPWRVRSARVARGDAWDLCTRTNFRTPCNRIAENRPSVNWVVASARPSQVVTLPEPVDQSLRGMTAEFFPRPSDTRGRVISCASGAAACAEDSAQRFCRARGWNGIAYFRQETVGGRNFLADVLCTLTGGRP